VTQSTNPALRSVLDEFSRQLSEHFGPRLLSLTLFGSYARGDAGPDSDIDVVIVLDRIHSHGERVWPMQLSGSLEGPVLVAIVLSKDELDFLRAREDSLAESLDREGIALQRAPAWLRNAAEYCVLWELR
jgi:uncharacterized protein